MIVNLCYPVTASILAYVISIAQSLSRIHPKKGNQLT